MNATASRLLYIALALCQPLAPTAVLADESAIQAHCQDEWPADADMRAYCVGEQRQAAKALGGYSGSVRERCEAEWLPAAAKTECNTRPFR
ncbi:hypothetical protein [Pseudomonas aeruginosa]|uniref:hypothetical protein n=1 Tax=Pseudomonas aeruginosa TaxID=287 RepID=UPI000F62102B|nr:hypothetical protein [Pseudomonas aeruginosa]RRJ12368.1 hypothetical protein EIM05_26005 [Pseudomonas aeruginosa]